MSLSNPTNPPILNEHVATRVSTGLVFAVDENQTRLNQIHGINPAGSTGAGIPKPVNNVSAAMANASVGATSTISVNFQRDPSDKNYSRVVIFAKGYQGNNSPVQVGGSADSPCTVILNNTGESVIIIVQSVGNGGVSPISTSPTCAIKLPKNASGGFGTGTNTNLTSGQVVQSAPPTLVTLVVIPTAMPWDQTINSGSPFGSNDGTIATQAGIALVPGQKIAVAYVSGGVKASSLGAQTTDLQGNPSGSPAAGPPFSPSHYVSGSTLKVAGLVGAFVDTHGVVKGFFDLSGGSGSTFVVPAGASRVQFGINDTLYNDNTGPGYTIVVAIVASSILIEVNGTFAGSQNKLNLIGSITDDGIGGITFSGGGGSTNFAPIVPLPAIPTSTPSTWNNSNFPNGLTLYMRVSGRKIVNGCTKFKVALGLNNGTLVISNAIIRSTLLEGTVWQDPGTQIQWGGSNTPTFAVVGDHVSDFITYTIDPDHDYYILVDINVTIGGAGTGSGCLLAYAATNDPLVALATGFKSSGAVNDTTAATNAANFTGNGSFFFSRFCGQ